MGAGTGGGRAAAAQVLPADRRGSAGGPATAGAGSRRGSRPARSRARAGGIVMTGREVALRLASALIRGACRRLPDGARDDRRREWEAELAAILDDPAV